MLFDEERSFCMLYIDFLYVYLHIQRYNNPKSKLTYIYEKALFIFGCLCYYFY